ncbi:MAG: FAD:protein FMN transferase, partial [Flavobacteriales bacterium]
ARMKRFTMKLLSNVLPIVFSVIICGCDPSQKMHTGRNYTGELLGKKYEIDIPDDTLNRTALIDSVFTTFEQIFNSTNPHSLISEINSYHRNDTVFVLNDSARLFGIVSDLASDLCRKTVRSWDPASAPLRRNMLTAGNLGDVSDSLLEACSFNELNIRMQEHFDERGKYESTSLLKRNLLTELDFTDIASALAVDYLAEAFILHGIKSFKISHDGDVKCHGLNGNPLGTIELGIGSNKDNPKVDIGNTSFAMRDATDKQSMVDPETGYTSSGPIVYVAIATPLLTEARIFSQAFIIKDLNSISNYYTQNPDSKIHSFIFFQQGDTLQNASTSGFDNLIISSNSVK